MMNPSPFVLFFVVSTSPTGVSSSSQQEKSRKVYSTKNFPTLSPSSSSSSCHVSQFSVVKLQIGEKNRDSHRSYRPFHPHWRWILLECALNVPPLTTLCPRAQPHSAKSQIDFRLFAFTTRILALIPQLCLRNIHLIKSELSTPTSDDCIFGFKKPEEEEE
ncbi:hypothetical protein YC2023_075644 [Brassica napus]